MCLKGACRFFIRILPGLWPENVMCSSTGTEDYDVKIYWGVTIRTFFPGTFHNRGGVLHKSAWRIRLNTIWTWPNSKTVRPRIFWPGFWRWFSVPKYSFTFPLDEEYSVAVPRGGKTQFDSSKGTQNLVFQPYWDDIPFPSQFFLILGSILLLSL